MKKFFSYLTTGLLTGAFGFIFLVLFALVALGGLVAGIGAIITFFTIFL